MALGMSYEDYWRGDPEMARAYREAHKLRIKMKNEELWLQGLYIYNALEVTLANAFAKKGASKHKYLEKPLDILPKTEDEQEKERKEAQEKITAQLKAMQAGWKKRYGGNNDKSTKS